MLITVHEEVDNNQLVLDTEDKTIELASIDDIEKAKKLGLQIKSLLKLSNLEVYDLVRDWPTVGHSAFNREEYTWVYRRLATEIIDHDKDRIALSNYLNLIHGYQVWDIVPYSYEFKLDKILYTDQYKEILKELMLKYPNIRDISRFLLMYKPHSNVAGIMPTQDQLYRGLIQLAWVRLIMTVVVKEIREGKAPSIALHLRNTHTNIPYLECKEERKIAKLLHEYKYDRTKGKASKYSKRYVYNLMHNLQVYQRLFDIQSDIKAFYYPYIDMHQYSTDMVRYYQLEKYKAEYFYGFECFDSKDDIEFLKNIIEGKPKTTKFKTDCNYCYIKTDLGVDIKLYRPIKLVDNTKAFIQLVKHRDSYEGKTTLVYKVRTDIFQSETKYMLILEHILSYCNRRRQHYYYEVTGNIIQILPLKKNKVLYKGPIDSLDDVNKVVDILYSWQK